MWDVQRGRGGILNYLQKGGMNLFWNKQSDSEGKIIK